MGNGIHVYFEHFLKFLMVKILCVCVCVCVCLGRTVISPCTVRITSHLRSIINCSFVTSSSDDTAEAKLISFVFGLSLN
jgi:hypothetical protein